jgi:hypothetical protein
MIHVVLSAPQAFCKWVVTCNLGTYYLSGKKIKIVELKLSMQL